MFYSQITHIANAKKLHLKQWSAGKFYYVQSPYFNYLSLNFQLKK